MPAMPRIQSSAAWKRRGVHTDRPCTAVPVRPVRHPLMDRVVMCAAVAVGDGGAAGVLAVVQGGIDCALEQGQVAGVEDVGRRGANRGGDVDRLAVVQAYRRVQHPHQLVQEVLAAAVGIRWIGTLQRRCPLRRRDAAPRPGPFPPGMAGYAA